MKRILLIALLASPLCTHAQAPAGAPAIAPGSAVDPAVSLNAMLDGTEKQMMGLVKAMPADKYDFAPSAAIFVSTQKTEYTGVRTFGALVVHVAQANYGYGGRIGGLKPDVDPKTLATLKTKDEMVAALAASFEFLHKAMGTVTAANAFESVRGPSTKITTAAGSVVHCADEYGQMVEYLRMNGMVPPASQR